MVNESQLAQHLADIKDLVRNKLSDNAKAIAALKAQVEAGTPVTQGQLEELDAQAQSIISSLMAAGPETTDSTTSAPATDSGDGAGTAASDPTSNQ